MRANRVLVLGIVSLFLLSACEKAESPITLPPANGAQMATVSMGENYETQVYYDFTTAKVVKSSPYNIWDLAFESDAEGYHVFINDAKNLFAYNTHLTDLNSVNENQIKYRYLSTDSMALDKPCGLPDSTAIGAWCDANRKSKNEFYIIRLSSQQLKKMRILSVTDTNYVVEYGDLDGSTMNTLSITKNSECNYTYFSFDGGGTLVNPEPPKDSWDVVFTYYRHYYNELSLPYLVSGVLLNPYKTTGLSDSVTGFEKVNYDFVKDKPFTNHRDVIGYGWKIPHVDMATGTAVYTIDPLKTYVVKNQQDEYWKIHFLNFYNANNEKGYPSFEFMRIH